MSDFLRIYVPSKARAEIFEKKTYSLLRETTIPWIVSVEPKDYQAYLKIVKDPKKIIVLDQIDQGFGYALHFIQQHAVADNVEYVWKMDDDTYHWYDKSGKVKPKDEQADYLTKVRALLVQADITSDKFVGFSFPQKYFHSDWRPFTHVNKTFQTTFIVNPKEWFTPLDLKGYHDEFMAMAHIISKGLFVLRVGAYCWDANLSTYEGGLQMFNREKEQTEFFKVMEKNYPQFIAMTKAKEYTQPNGKIFTVTDKTFFNRHYALKLPLKKKECYLPEETVRCLSALQSSV